MVDLAAPLPGTTYAGARWSTLAYVEKVRSQFLSLRQGILFSLIFFMFFGPHPRGQPGAARQRGGSTGHIIMGAGRPGWPQLKSVPGTHARVAAEPSKDSGLGQLCSRRPHVIIRASGHNCILSAGSFRKNCRGHANRKRRKIPLRASRIH
jgi:hypothetical protein